MEQVATLGSIAGLIAATTLIVQFLKGWLKVLPVPPMALVIGVGLTLLGWGTGKLTVPGTPFEGAGWADWTMVGIHALVGVVLPAMGAATLVSDPKRAVVRNGRKKL